MTVTGTAFEGATAVRFGNVPAVFSVDSDVQITATVPAWATSGPITVTTLGGTATSSVDFLVTPKPKPSLGKPICPTSVRHGKSFSVYGSLKPQFDAGTRTVTVKMYRYASGKWRFVKSYRAVNSDYSSYTRYTAKLTVKMTGKYRFKAFAAVTSLWAAASSSYSRTLTVK